MGHITYCIMCLATDVKMYRMNAGIIGIYNELISLQCTTNVKEMTACYECAYMLQKYGEFKTQCCKAYSILSNLSPVPFEVTTEENLNIVDKLHNKLGTKLTSCIATYDFQPKPRKGVSKKPLKFGTVKTVPITFLNNFATHKDNHINLKTEQNQMNQEKVPHIKSAPDCDDEDDYNGNTYETESCNYNSNDDNSVWINIDRTDKNLELEAMEKNDVASSSQLDQKCYKNVYNSIILDTHPLKIRIKQEVMDSDEKKELKNGSKDLPKTVDLANDANVKPIKKRRNRKKGVKVSNIDKSSFLTLDSKVFKEYMSVVKLSPEDARRELRLRKESSNYIRNAYRCDLCYRGYSSKVAYESHLKKHSLEYGSFQCGLCKLCFTTRLSLTRHRLTTHTRKYSCRICSYVCFSNSQCKAHIQGHRGKEYTCNKCGRTYRFQNSLLTHMHLKHSVECVCDFCGSTFASAKGLEKHKHLIHRKEQNELLGPQCTECDIHFATELAWKRHLVLCSRHQVQYGCRVCGDIFQNSESLKIHARDHAPPVHWSHKMRENWPKKCNFCKIPQPTRLEYRKHVIAEHPSKMNNRLMKFLNDDYVCEVCGMAYSSPSVLALHQRKHSDEMPYSCPICGMRTKYKSTLIVHRRIHSNEYTDKYQCDLCSRPFSDKSRLVRHIKGHMGIRPYKCRKEYCDKTFMYQCDEKTHFRHVHCKEPYPKGDGSRSGNRKITRTKLQVFQI